MRPDVIEAVSRALCKLNGYDPDDMSNAHNVGGPMWMLWRQEAITAIQVIAAAADKTA